MTATEKQVEFEIGYGPTNSQLQYALFAIDNPVAQSVVFTMARDEGKNQPGFTYSVKLTSARRCHPTATIWELEGIIDTQGGKKRVSIYYLSDTHTGRMRIEKELHKSFAILAVDESEKSSALLDIIFKMIHVYRKSHQGNLNEQIFRLFEKAKVVYAADSPAALAEAINKKV